MGESAIRSIQCCLAALGLTGALSLAGCAGHMPTATQTAPDSSPQPAGPGGLILPALDALATVRRPAFLPPGNTLCGAQVDGLAPPQRVQIEGDVARFHPSTTGSDQGFAFAVYRFDLAAINGAPTLRFEWQWLDRERGIDLYAAVPDYTRNRWRWHSCPNGQDLPLTTQQLAAAITPASGDLFIVLACTTGGGHLRQLRIGDPAPSSIQITGVNVSQLRPREKRLLIPAYSGGEPVAWRWSGGYVEGPRHGKTALAVGLGDGQVMPMQVVATDAAGGEASYSFQLKQFSAAELPPKVTGVMESAGHAGGFIRATQQVADGYADGYYDLFTAQHHWDFGGGAQPNTALGWLVEAKLGAAGTYPARLTVVSPIGSSNFDFTLTVCPPDQPLPPHVIGWQDAAAVGPAMAGRPAKYAAEYYRGFPENVSWNFGPAATPAASTELAPQVAFQTYGEHPCTLVSSNASGQAQSAFTAAVLAPMPPYIRLARVEQGCSGQPGWPVQGTLWHDSLHWDFGGGAEPNTSSAAAPEVTLGAPGWYLGRLTATNAQGSAKYLFAYVVDPLFPPELTHIAGIALAETPVPEIWLIRDYPWPIEATLAGSPAFEVSWDFGGAAQPNTPVVPLAADNRTGRVEITAPVAGNFTGQVTVRNAAGEEARQFNIVVLN